MSRSLSTAPLSPAPPSPAPKAAGQRSFLLRTHPASDGVPFSSTEDHPEFFNQYVHPAPHERPVRWRFFWSAVGGLDVECYQDGTPVQIIIWKNTGVVVRSLRLPTVDYTRRATFVQGDRGAPAPPLWDPTQQRLLYDPENKRVRMQLIETMETQCVQLAKQALVELTSEGELAALWMLDTGDASPDAGVDAMRAMAAQRARPV